MPCNRCAPFDGLWMETPKGLRRCVCADGQRLSVTPTAHPPMLTADQSKVFVEMLAAMPYFPSEAGARVAIGDEIRSMCSSPISALWLVQRMLRLYRKWPGLFEIRQVYCSKHQPHDGIRPIGCSEVYPDGIPTEAETAPPQLPAPKVRLLGDGRKHEVIESGVIERAVAKAAAQMPSMPKAKSGSDRFSKLLEETITAPSDRPAAPPPTPQVITQDDIARAVAELRAKKAAEQK